MMKRLIFFLTIFSFASLLFPNSSAPFNPVLTDAGIQFGFFYSSLAPHGEWIEVESGFHVWRPFHIPHLWRPYLIGRWLWTDDGWYWMSSESFGWITYHYGRWYDDEYYGWVWVPDEVWAPAWVEWRYDDDFIGWAPLPPYATFTPTWGIRFTTHWIAPLHYWNIIRYHQFGSVIRYHDTAPEEYARRLIHTGRSGAPYGIDHERIINTGVDRTIIERRGNIRFTRRAVREFHGYSGERIARSNDDQHGEHIEVFRPSREEMKHKTEQIDIRRGERNLSIDLKRIEMPHSESRTPNVHERPSQRYRQEMRRELIQRYDRIQKPSPPARHEHSRFQREPRRENSRITQPRNPIHKGQSENRSN
jgi:hypothetical protein